MMISLTIFLGLFMIIQNNNVLDDSIILVIIGIANIILLIRAVYKTWKESEEYKYQKRYLKDKIERLNIKLNSTKKHKKQQFLYAKQLEYERFLKKFQNNK